MMGLSYHRSEICKVSNIHVAVGANLERFSRAMNGPTESITKTVFFSYSPELVKIWLKRNGTLAIMLWTDEGKLDMLISGSGFGTSDFSPSRGRSLLTVLIPIPDNVFPFRQRSNLGTETISRD